MSFVCRECGRKEDGHGNRRVCESCKTIACEWCGSSWKVRRPSDIDGARFCSPKCHYDHRVGMDRSAPDGMKRCIECGEAKRESEFGKRGDGMRSRCRPCRRATRDYSGEFESRDFARFRMYHWRATEYLLMSPEARKVRDRFRAHLKRVRIACGHEREDGVRALNLYPVECPECGNVAMRRKSSRFCSDRCNNMHKKRQRRARKRDAWVEDVGLSYLIERDAGKCGICGETVRVDAKYPHPRSATVDHIIPLSQGGEHSKRNTQLAHAECNFAKKDRSSGSQLLLIG